MKILRFFACIIGSWALLVAPASPAFSMEDHMTDTEKLVIAHRGASGYLPEHTLAAKAMAYAMGADYMEQDLVMTKDNRVIVLHDHHLDQVTNVRDIFPDRKRSDGRYYVIDFTLAEIRKLSVLERFQIRGGKMEAVFPDRFPLGKSYFRIHTLEEEIELVQGLNRATGNNTGIYPEIKNPAFHRGEGRDISGAVLNILKKYGYTKKTDNIFLQCFDAKELKYIHDRLLPELDMDLKLVQLLDGAEEYRRFFTEDGMTELAGFADGIGPSIHMIVLKDSTADNLKITPLVKAAHQAGLKVHPYTFRMDKNMIPAYAKDYDDLLDIFLFRVGVDGLFTDFPDKTVDFLKARTRKNKTE